MTESEYASLHEFYGLPVFNKNDKGSNSLHQVDDQGYTGRVVEVGALELARRYCLRSDFTPKGAVRYSDGQNMNLRVFFWEKRME